jgi:hypothetical protein
MKQDIPFQVEHIINSLLDKKESVHLRQNYRQRLVSIQESVDKAIRMYDNELYISNTQGKKKLYEKGDSVNG